MSQQRREDLRSLGNEGLVCAARLFDPSLGVPFAAFAAMHVRWAMLRGLRVDRRQRRGQVQENFAERARMESTRLRVAEPLLSTSEPDAEARLADAQEDAARRAMVAVAVAQLRPKDREVIDGHYFEERELRSLVRSGASYATVRRRHKGALAKLGKRLARGSISASANLG